MHRLPPWIWLLLAGVFATTASLAWLKNQSRPVAIVDTSVMALVAKKDIAPATRLDAEQVQSSSWSPAHLPKGAFTNLAELEGRVAAYPLVEGELVLEKKLAPKGTLSGFTALLPATKRAMTVKVDEASGVAGFVAPDNRVDVLVTIDKGEYNGNPLSRVLLQNLRVLGTGQKIESRPGDKPQVVPTVTLEVSPEEGERLALASQEGHISLVLRGQEDFKLVATQGVKADTLFGPGDKIRKNDTDLKPAAPPRHTVQVIKGLQQAPVSF
jgi:pilus assembly protein CpaB